MSDKEKLHHQAETRIGTLLKGKYQLDRLLGIGGMAAVYAATHRNHRRFAVKMLHAELSSRLDIQKRFIREGYIANLVEHEGVVTVIDDDVSEDGSAYLVMELLEGVSVEKLCRTTEDTVPSKEALLIAHQALDVLAAAHAQSVVHRDIKPANLLVTREGRVKVLDFGIARLKETANESALTRTGARMGTPAYMSPEQAMAKSSEIDACTDVWSVGATLFRMLSGRYVHQGDNASEVAIRTATEPARSLAEVAPDVPAGVVEVVDKALAFHKKDRFESAAAMQEAIEAAHLALFGELSSEALSSYIATRIEDTSAPVPAESDVSSRTEPVTPGVLDVAASSTAKTPKHRNRSWPIVAGAVLLLALGGWAAGRFITPTPSGRLTVRITTDMLSPTDVDWVSWELTSKSRPSLKKRGGHAIADWTALPLVLAKISTDEVMGPAKMAVTARRGGRRGERVMNQTFPIEVPKRGTQQVTLSLDWLCSEGMLESPCSSGTVCLAGECVPFKDAVINRDPNPQAKPKCFDTERCFASGVVVTVPLLDAASGQCLLSQSHALMNAEKKNIALVVNTKAMGNFGVCGPAGQCLIPMDKESGGWEVQREAGQITAIRLPKAVCRAVGQGKIRGVALVPAMSGCPPKSPSIPLCSAPDTCVATNDICPQDLPAAWEGFTCSGAASPQMMRKDLIGCFIPPKKDESPQPSGQWCCSKGEPPGSDPLLIDDMSGGPQLKLIPPKNYRGGMWWTASDAKGIDISPPPNPGMFTLTTIDPPVAVDEERTFNRAACVRSPGFSGWIALMGYNFISAKDDAMAPPFDVSAYSGIRFWAYSPQKEQQIKVGFADQNTYTEDARSTCNRNPKDGKCGDDWAVQSLTITPEWKEYVVKWSDLKQSKINWGQARYDAFDKKHVFTTYFGVNGKGPKKASPPFEFCISQIYFTE